MRLNFILVGLITLAAALGGCGSGGGDSSGGDGTGASAQSTTTAAGGATTNAGNTTQSGDDGGSKPGSESRPSNKVLTKAEMIEEGDLICKRASLSIVRELQSEKTKYGRGFGRTPTQKQNEEGLVDLMLPGLSAEAEELRTLNPPPADKAKIEAMISALEDGIEKTEEDPSQAFSGPNPLAKASTLSKKYGFKICGS